MTSFSHMPSPGPYKPSRAVPTHSKTPNGRFSSMWCFRVSSGDWLDSCIPCICNKLHMHVLYIYNVHATALHYNKCTITTHTETVRVTLHALPHHNTFLYTGNPMEKPWSQVSTLLPSGTMPPFSSRIGCSVPIAR